MTPLRQTSRAMLLTLGVVLTVTILSYAFLAQFVTKFDGGRAYDGLGRELQPMPVSLLFLGNRNYPGRNWFLVDSIGGVVGLAATAWVFALAARSK